MGGGKRLPAEDRARLPLGPLAGGALERKEVAVRPQEPRIDGAEQACRGFRRPQRAAAAASQASGL